MILPVLIVRLVDGRLTQRGSATMIQKFGLLLAVILLATFVLPTTAWALPDACFELNNDLNAVLGTTSTLHAKLKAALTTAQATANGGFGLHMWGTIVDRSGVVCAVAYTGPFLGAQWPGSRVISAQKANTANAFSLPTLPLSTANLYSAVQPGGSLFGLQESNPVDTSVAYEGDNIIGGPSTWGTPSDDMTGHRIGGINVFGGGLALYLPGHILIGAIGVSGDSSCADHNIAWKTRSILNADDVPGGVASASNTDNIVYDIATPGGNPAIAPKSASGWGHPQCSASATTIGNSLPSTYPVGPSH
jgi:uncharacterized protein GlcG (DUF336 family)